MAGLTSMVGSQYEHLDDVLNQYRSYLDEAPDRLRISGKPLGKANGEQVGWLAYYDERRVELKALVKYTDMRVASVRGRLYRQYTEIHSRELSDRMKDKYIDNDNDYLVMNELLIEIEEVYEKMVAVVEAFKARGFALRNLTELAVHEINEV
jgi:hypothetical protein